MMHCTEQSVQNSLAHSINKTSTCTAQLDTDATRATLMTNCNNKTTCDIAIGLSDLTWLSGTAPSDSSDCGTQAYMYAQVGCEIESNLTKERRIFGLMIGCIGVFVYLFTIVYYDYIKDYIKA